MRPDDAILTSALARRQENRAARQRRRNQTGAADQRASSRPRFRAVGSEGSPCRPGEDLGRQADRALVDVERGMVMRRIDRAARADSDEARWNPCGHGRSP
jgi:hypothetical protein